jgi:hypothetical protein
LYVSGAEVQSRIHAGVDDLVQSIREPIEVARFTWETAARHTELDLICAEEYF